MRRVLFVSHTSELGGAELFLLDAVKGNPAWDACFFAAGPALELLRARDHKGMVLEADQAFLSIRRDTGVLKAIQAIRSLIGLGLQLGRASRNFDIIAANSQKALFVCAVASLFTGRKLVWILHDIITDAAFSGVNRRAAVFVSRLFARAVIVNSAATADAYRSAGGDAALLREVPNGFDVSRGDVGAAETGLRAEFGFDERPIAAIFGRLARWKGQSVFLHALREEPRVQGLIVGAALFGEDEYERELTNGVAELGLASRVVFAGFRSDVARLMSGVDVIVHASVAPEPFGRVIVEGMLSGRPIIATRGGAIESIVQDKVTGLVVEPNDPTDLAAAITSLIDQPAMAASIAARGRAHAAEHYSIERVVAEISEIFEAV